MPARSDRDDDIDLRDTLVDGITARGRSLRGRYWRQGRSAPRPILPILIDVGYLIPMVEAALPAEGRLQAPIMLTGHDTDPDTILGLDPRQ